MRMIVDAVYPILLKVRPNEGLSAYHMVAFAQGFDSQVGQNDAMLTNTHQQLVKVIRLLTDVVRAQKENTQALERRLVVQNRKFREARLSVNDLILDQDALLNSNLTTISTQLEIINTIFDYLVVFTETPCEFNRI